MPVECTYDADDGGGEQVILIVPDHWESPATITMPNGTTFDISAEEDV